MDWSKKKTVATAFAAATASFCNWLRQGRPFNRIGRALREKQLVRRVVDRNRARCDRSLRAGAIVQRDRLPTGVLIVIRHWRLFFQRRERTHTHCDDRREHDQHEFSHCFTFRNEGCCLLVYTGVRHRLLCKEDYLHLRLVR